MLLRRFGRVVGNRDRWLGARGAPLTAVGLAFVLTVAGHPLDAPAAPSPAVRVWMASASGQPGEEVALELHVASTLALQYVMVRFDVPRVAAKFLRTSVADTASSHAPPRGVIFDPDYWEGGYLIGVRFDFLAPTGVGPGEDLLVAKAIFHILPDAASAEYDIQLLSVLSALPVERSISPAIEIEGAPVLRVMPPSGPRPVRDLSCSQTGSEVTLAWTATEACDTVAVRRGGELLATLPGSAATYRDAPPLGPATDSVTCRRGEKDSLGATCEALVLAPRPPAITGFSAAEKNGTVSLSWVNGASYESIQIYRNGTLIDELDGQARSYSDPWGSDLFTVYSVRGQAAGMDSWPATVTLNELTSDFILRAEHVHARPGDINVPVRIFATNPHGVHAIGVSLRIAPELARIRDVTVEGTAVDAAGFDHFLTQEHVYERGEVVAGILFTLTPPFHNLFPAGADQHILTVLVDVLETAPGGASIPVAFGQFGQPPQPNVFVYTITNIPAVTHHSAIHIGASPVPGVEKATVDAEDAAASPADPALAAAQERGLTIRWQNAAAYSAIRIGRDGQLLAEVEGARTSFRDEHPGPGVHRYEIRSIKDGVESFPVVVTSRPRRVPGAFLRGDADASDRVNIVDAILVLAYLFRSGPEPTCLDGADADDDGRLGVADALNILFYVFLGSDPLPLPGVEGAWFDPTPDGLDCE